MKRIISLLLVAILVSGCGRLQSGGNAENFDDISGVVKHTHTPLSSDPANLPIPTSPTPTPTAHAKPIDELCGSEENVLFYLLHSVLSFGLNSALAFLAVDFPSLCYFFTILRMVSVFSFPVHVYLTNPSFLSKSKLSLTALAADTCLSLYKLITKNPTLIFNINIGYIHFFLEFIRVFAYPHIYFIKGAIWK